jgi:hypothetical protein
MERVTVTYRRCDSTRDFESAGPFTQHVITGLELADLLEANVGTAALSIETIEASTLSTGIPSAGIRPEDLAADPSLPIWRGEIMVQHLRDMVKKLQEQQMTPMPGPFPKMPMPGQA